MVVFFFVSGGQVTMHLFTTSVARSFLSQIHPLCEESQHLPMPLGVREPSHKAMNLSRFSKPGTNIRTFDKSCSTSSSISGNAGYSALWYTPILFR